MKTKILLSILILLAVIGCRRKSSDNYEYYKPYEKDTLLVDVADSLADIDSLEVKMEPQIIEVKGVDLNDSYFIVIASYGVEAFAKAKKNELIEQGLKPEIFMVNDDGWFKLAIESYQTFEEASNGLEKLKLDNAFPSARIVFKKSK